MDAVGGRSFRRSYNLLRPGGRLVVFGSTSAVSGESRNLPAALRAVATMPRFNLLKQMSESKTVVGLNMLTLWKDRGTMQPWIEPLRELLEDGTIEPVIAGRVSIRPGGRRADDDRRAAQHRQGRPDTLSATCAPVLPSASRMSFQISLLPLLLLPPRGE